MTPIPDIPLMQWDKIETIAVFRALQLGDMLCAVPALRALRTALPKTRITLIGLPWAEQFVRRFQRYLDDFVTFPGHPEFPEQPVQKERIPSFYTDMQERRFDLAIQLHGSGQISNSVIDQFGARIMAGFATDEASRTRGGCFIDYPISGPEPLRLLRLTEFLGAQSIGTHLEFPLHDEDIGELVQSGIPADLTPGSYICIHPGARFRDKCWSPPLFAEVADRLCDEFRVTIVLTGSAKETDLTAAVASHMRHSAIDTAGPISIGAMAALMRSARLLICNDTGVSHIAAGLCLPSVVIFSKADISRWSPLDFMRHHCLWDPQGKRVEDVLWHARELLLQGSVSSARDKETSPI